MATISTVTHMFKAARCTRITEDFSEIMKRVAITGAGGSIGSSLTRAIISMGATVCAIDNSEDALFRLGGSITSTDDQNKLRLFLGDIRDRGRLLTAFDRVDTVFHCAAVKHVGLNEYNPTEAVKTNILGTENIIEAAIEKNVNRVVYTSSDKAVNPTNTMGATKPREKYALRPII